MARAKAGTGFFLVVGLAVVALPAVRAADDPPRVAPLFSSKPSKALSEAIEAQRHGDYERAAALLEEAFKGQASLTQTEQQELARVMNDNTAAREGRRAAADQLRQAQFALQENRQADAVDLLKRVAANEQYLTTADREAFRKCSAGLNLPGAGGPPAAPAAVAGAAQFRSPRRPTAARPAPRGRRVRRPGARGSRAPAPRPAPWCSRRAAISSRAISTWPKRKPRTPPPSTSHSPRTRIRRLASSTTWPARAPTPRPCSRRRGPRCSARTSTGPSSTPHQSDKASSTWALTLWGDTPAKALKDIQAARAAASPAPKAEAPKPPVVVADDAAAGREEARSGSEEAPLPSPGGRTHAAEGGGEKAEPPPAAVQASKPAEVKPASFSPPADAKITAQAATALPRRRWRPRPRRRPRTRRRPVNCWARRARRSRSATWPRPASSSTTPAR